MLQPETKISGAVQNRGSCQILDVIRIVEQFTAGGEMFQTM